MPCQRLARTAAAFRVDTFDETRCQLAQLARTEPDIHAHAHVVELVNVSDRCACDGGAIAANRASHVAPAVQVGGGLGAIGAP